MKPVLVMNFYKFCSLTSPELLQLQPQMQALFASLEIKGTVLLANEGINVGLAGKPKAIFQARDWLYQAIPALAKLHPKFSWAKQNPFGKLKIKIKPEIVTLKYPINPERIRPESLLNHRQWNNLLSDPEVVIIDTRNDYEVQEGTFKGAQNPNTEQFTEFKDFVEQSLGEQKDRKLAIFCTGGIRCEKAAVYLEDLGFSQVYQLDGGILRYLEEVDQKESLWQGDCFVFDDRRVVDPQLQEK